MSTTQTRKAAARRELLARRATRRPTSAEATTRNAAVRAYLDLFGARCVALYVSTEREPDTSQLRDELRTAKITVLLPVLQPDNTLTFAVDDGTTRPGLRGISIPTGPAATLERADVVIVPALAVDRTGRRLGRGGGSYDRALANLPLNIPVIALLHPGELVDDLPAEPHDVRMDAAADADQLVRFGPRTG